MTVDPADPDRCTAHRLYRQLLRLRRFEADRAATPRWGGLESVPVGVLEALGPDDAVVLPGADPGLAWLRGVGPVQGALDSGSPATADTGPSPALDDALARRALRPGAVSVRFLPPGAAMPGGCGVVVHGAADRKPRTGAATVLPVEALDVVAVWRATREALALARAGQGPVLLACAAREAQPPPQPGALAARGPFCDPVDRMRAWARDHLLLSHCDCVAIERGVEVELTSAREASAAVVHDPHDAHDPRPEVPSRPMLDAGPLR